MATHRRRAFLLRAGVVASLALGSILAIGAPASAATEMSASDVTIEAGGDQKPVTVTVKADPGGDLNNVYIEADSLPSGVSCSSGCGNGAKFDVSADQSVTRTIYLKAGSSAAEGGSNGTLALKGSMLGSASASVRISVKPKASTTIQTISGTVKDVSTGSKLDGALVIIKDPSGKTHNDTTDSSGSWSFTSSAADPIQAGTIYVGVSLDGYTTVTKSYSVAAGQSKTGISIGMSPKGATASPSVEESPTEEATVDPNATASADPNATESAGAGAVDTTATGDDSGSGLSWMMIIVGGLLVLLGIGAIALILMRRNKDDDEDDEDDEDDAPVRRATPPRSGGGYYGARPAAADPTMVARSPMNDAPTTVQRPGEYGARPQQGGWTGYGQDAQPTQTYGSGGYSPSAGGGAGAGTYGSPAGGQAYGSPSAGGSTYGAPAGGAYGSPVGPSAGGAYGSPAGGGAYGSPVAGGAYGSPAAPTSGYGSGTPGGYGAAPQAGGGYGSPAAPGSEYGSGAAGGYGANGSAYGSGQQAGGYDQGGSYGSANGGYGQGGGYDQGYGAQGGYGQQPSGGYGDSAGGYGAGGQAAGSYDQGYGAQGGYGQQPSGGYGDSAGGYGSQGAYGSGAQGAGTYGSGSGYVPEQRGAGYDQGAYGEATQRYGQDSYGQQANGYDDPSRRADRRLDWLDD